MSQSVEHKSHQYLCTMCVGEYVDPERVAVLKENNMPITCMVCGQKAAILKAAQYTIAPMHKSNYMLITNLEDLKGLNNKGGLIK